MPSAWRRILDTEDDKCVCDMAAHEGSVFGNRPASRIDKANSHLVWFARITEHGPQAGIGPRDGESRGARGPVVERGDRTRRRLALLIDDDRCTTDLSANVVVDLEQLVDGRHEVIPAPRVGDRLEERLIGPRPHRAGKEAYAGRQRLRRL